MAHGDEDEQHQQELALLDEVGLAGLEDDLGDVEHRLVRRQLVDLVAQVEADAERAGDDEGAAKQQVPGADVCRRRSNVPSCRSGMARSASLAWAGRPSAHSGRYQEEHEQAYQRTDFSKLRQNDRRFMSSHRNPRLFRRSSGGSRAASPLVGPAVVGPV